MGRIGPFGAPSTTFVHASRRCAGSAAKKGCPKQTAPWARRPAAAVVQRLQEEHLRKDVIGYGSLGEALAAQGGRAEEASKAFEDALACCPAGVPPHLQRAYAHYCGAYAALCEEVGDRQRAQELYERGLSVHPTCPTCLGNLPLFLQSCKRPSNEIEAAYKAFLTISRIGRRAREVREFLRHALRAGPRRDDPQEGHRHSEDADALGAYAVLLHAVRPHDPLTEQFMGEPSRRTRRPSTRCRTTACTCRR